LVTPVLGAATGTSLVLSSSLTSAGIANTGTLTNTGNATVSGNLAVTGATALTSLSTSGLATLNSATITNNTSIGGTLGVTGVATLTAQPILSSLAISQAVFTDASKGLVSKALTGTGNVVLSDSPTLTGVPVAPTATVGTSTTQLATTAFVAAANATNANLTGPVTSVGNATTITNGAVTQAKLAAGIILTEAADEPAVSAGQTSISLTQTPSVRSKVKMYINGVRISNSAYTLSSFTITYIPANNGGYVLVATDRIQFDYSY